MDQPVAVDQLQRVIKLLRMGQGPMAAVAWRVYCALPDRKPSRWEAAIATSMHTGDYLQAADFCSVGILTTYKET